MSSLFQNLVDPDGGAVTFDIGTGAIPGTAAIMRNLFVDPVGLPPFAIYASAGEALASVGAGGMSFDANGRLRVTSNAPATPVQLPGGILADANGALVITDTAPQLIYQGVGLSDEGALSFTVDTVTNLLLNSTWSGASGSVAGADWIPPTSWSNSFWPPDNAIAIPNVSGNGDTGIEFITVTNRGYMSIDVDTTALVGQTFNLSIFVDEVIDGGAYANVSGGNVTIIRNFPPVTAGFVGRVDAVYTITGNAIGIRFGAGVTSNATSQFSLSRPQATIGETLLPFAQT